MFGDKWWRNQKAIAVMSRYGLDEAVASALAERRKRPTYRIYCVYPEAILGETGNPFCKWIAGQKGTYEGEADPTLWTDQNGLCCEVWRVDSIDMVSRTYPLTCAKFDGSVVHEPTLLCSFLPVDQGYGEPFIVVLVIDGKEYLRREGRIGEKLPDAWPNRKAGQADQRTSTSD